jgi:hypothetical protein
MFAERCSSGQPLAQPAPSSHQSEHQETRPLRTPDRLRPWSPSQRTADHAHVPIGNTTTETRPGRVPRRRFPAWYSPPFVLGPHRRSGLLGHLQGSVAAAVIAHTTTPVLVIPKGCNGQDAHIETIAATDVWTAAD